MFKKWFDTFSIEINSILYSALNHVQTNDVNNKFNSILQLWPQNKPNSDQIYSYCVFGRLLLFPPYLQHQLRHLEPLLETLIGRHRFVVEETQKLVSLQGFLEVALVDF